MMKFRVLLLSAVLAVVFCSASWSQEPGWWGVIVAEGEDEARIQATPILNRPYRPLHFYGNTIRRRYYRGTAVPLPRDVVSGTRAFLFRRTLR